MRVIKKGFLCLALTCVFCLANMATALASFEYGDNGPEVLAIQKRLVELKYEIKLLDGDFGSETEAAVKRFQADQQLEVDGIIGEATYTALMQKPMPPNRSGRSATVRNVIRAAYGVIGTPYVLAERVYMASTAPVLPSMLSRVQASAFRVLLMCRCTADARLVPASCALAI